MKPTVKVWPLPRLTQPQFEELFGDIVQTCKGIRRLQVRDENDIVVGFPQDAMEFGLGIDLVMEVGIPKVFLVDFSTASASEELTCCQIARIIGQTIKNFFARLGSYPNIQYEGRVTHGGNINHGE